MSRCDPSYSTLFSDLDLGDTGKSIFRHKPISAKEAILDKEVQKSLERIEAKAEMEKERLVKLAKWSLQKFNKGKI
jgi:hypothetical protein